MDHKLIRQCTEIRMMITPERMGAVDRNAAALGISQRQLMESSGRAVAEAVRDRAPGGARVVIVAGRGNNGGDGCVAPRFLDDYDVSLFLLGRADDISTEIARRNFDALRSGEYDIGTWRDSSHIDLPDADVIVDAILGTGVDGPVREPAATAIRGMNASDTPVVSVDIPSGIDPHTGTSASVAVAADEVVTFHDTKPGITDLDVPVTVADIGIPAAAETFVGPGDIWWLERDPTSHKGHSGRILVIGGGPYAGAPALSALAALRSGGDLATVACPASVADAVAGFSPNLIVHDLPGEALGPEHTDTLLDMADGTDVTVLGPGLGSDRSTLDAVESFLANFDGCCVVDADALQVVPQTRTSATLVCTPHQGELANMGGPRREDWRDRQEAVEEYARSIGHTLLVKGHYDIVSDGERTRVSRTGNPGMTVGGTGDVLAGIVATLFAQSEDPLRAASVGAYLNGSAGDLAADSKGDALLASDVVELIPDAIQAVTQ